MLESIINRLDGLEMWIVILWAGQIISNLVIAVGFYKAFQDIHLSKYE